MERNETIDIVKGITIILVVAGHCSSPGGTLFYLFHVALFIIVAGYCFNENYTNDVTSMKKLFISRVKSLYVPYILYHGILTLFHNVYMKLNIYTDNPNFLSVAGGSYGLGKVFDLKDFVRQYIEILLFVGGEQLGGTGWFLSLLFGVTILYAVILFALKKIFPRYHDAFMILISVIFMLVGYWCGKNDIYFPGRIATILSVMILFTIGKYIRQYCSKQNGVVNVIIFVVCITVLCFCLPFATISVTDNKYTNPIFFLICSVAGWFMIYSLSVFLGEIGFAKRVLVYVGRNTIPIIFLHFLCFKIVTAIVVTIKGYPKWQVACFPILDQRYWLLYLVTGVCIPLLFNYMLQKVIKLCGRKRWGEV